jgi:5-methylcytosine-specific restriction endonuclease McrA
MDNHTTIPAFRICNQCQQEFPFTADYFHRNKKAKYGFNTICKVCAKAKVKRWQSENVERVRETKRKSNQRHRERIRAKRSYDWRNNPRYRSDVQRRAAKWKDENKTRINARKRELRKQPKYRLQNRLAQQKRQRLTSLSQQQYFEIWEELQGRCAYCGISIFPEMERDATIEHIVPIVRGGTGDLINITLACLSCNSSKGDRLYDEWKAVRGW